MTSIKEMVCDASFTNLLISSNDLHRSKGEDKFSKSGLIIQRYIGFIS